LPLQSHYECIEHLKTLQNTWNIFAYTFQIRISSHYVCLKMQPHHIVACIEIFSTSQKLVDNLIMSKFKPSNYLMNIGDSSQVRISEVKVQLGSPNPCLLLIITHFHSNTFISCRKVFAFYCIHSKFWYLIQIDARIGNWKLWTS
jgi:hypothetical protein